MARRRKIRTMSANRRIKHKNTTPATAPDDSPLWDAPTSALDVGVIVEPALAIPDPVGLANPIPTDCPVPDEPPPPVGAKEPEELDTPDGPSAALAGGEAPEGKIELPVGVTGKPDGAELGCTELPLGGLGPGGGLFVGDAGVPPPPTTLGGPGPLPPLDPPLLLPPLLLPPPDPPLVPPPLPFPFPFPLPFPDPPPFPFPFPLPLPDPPPFPLPFPLLEAGVTPGSLADVLLGPLRTVSNSPPTTWPTPPRRGSRSPNEIWRR